MYIFLDIDWSFFDREYMGDKYSDYIWCAGIMIGTLLLKRPIANLITRISSGLAQKLSYVKHRGRIRSMLFKPIERLLQVVLYYVAIHQVDNFLDHFAIQHFISRKKPIDLKLGDVLDHIFLFLFIIFLTQVIVRFIDFIYYLRMSKAELDKNSSRIQLLPLIKEITKMGLWAMSGFWILGAVFHVNVAGLITGLGIGGVAIALAGKETVENFIASFTILSDKPFKTGDAIKLGDIEGEVERIGFRSTRLRNLDGSAYIIPNQNLVSQNLINLSFRDTRGMKVIANIKYGITPEALQKLTVTLKDVLISTPPVKAPVEVTIEIFDKETFQMVVSYHLPHPLPAGNTLASLKRDINLKVFGIINSSATVGTPVGTS